MYFSTRSYISVKVKEEDKLRPLRHVEKDGAEFEEVVITNDYISVYCHFDGYFNGVGLNLINDYNDYDSALNLVLGGSMSYICDGEVCYYSEKDEDLDYYDTAEPFDDESYAYKFEDDIWYAKKHGEEWCELSKLITDETN